MYNLGARIKRGVPGQSIVSTDYYPFQGGLNMVDPFLSIQPGQLLGCMNYEVYWRGGYRRVKGYERFDGRPSPHSATYTTVITDGDDSSLSAGDPVSWTGAGSGSGSVLVMTSEGNAVIGDYTGDEPQVGDTFNGNTVTIVRVNDTGIDEENEAAQTAAEEARRSLIGSVPGSGPIRGIAYYGGDTYAFRDDALGTKGVMWKSSPSGWTEVTLNQMLRFTDGQNGLKPNDGDVITGVTSGATATVRRTRVASGFFSNASAEGYVVVSDITGAFVSGEDVTIGGTVSFVTDGVLEDQTLAPGGRYDFRVRIFDNRLTDPRLYGVNGKGPCFEFDAKDGVFAFIETGMAVDQPNQIAAHNRMLFLSFRGGSIQNSAPNDPWSWSLISGASEILIGDECTGFVEEVNDALLIYSQEQVMVLYGQTSDEFNLVTLNHEMGAVAHTPKRIGSTIHLDQRGITSVSATDAYGNFAPSDLSQLIKPMLDQKGSDVFGAQISRSLNLYRLFYKDGTAIVLGFHGNQPAGFTLIDYGRPVTALWSSQAENNTERSFFASYNETTDEAFVYEQDVGRNFDGDPIEAFLLMVFYHSGSPEMNKRYRKAVIEMSGFKSTLLGSVDVNYGGTSASGSESSPITADAAGGFWDVAEWSEFKWSEGVSVDPSFYIEGTGFNIGLHLFHKSAVEKEHVVHGINITWSPRRLKREF